MPKYIKSVWRLVLEAAGELGKPFSASDIVNRIHENDSNIKASTIRCHVIGMAPNHPSSKHYPSLRNNHPAFRYLENGQFELLDAMKKTVNNDKGQQPPVGPRVEEWEKLREKIVGLQSNIAPFKVDFLDRETFKRFCDNLRSNVENLKEICITGYFSETIRAELESIARNDYYHVRLISPEFSLGTPRDRKNLEALKKLSEAGAEIKFNNRLHARLLVARTHISGLLILGSFDFNTECIGKERYDAGIKTSHPDLIQSAIDFFEQVWNDSGTITIEEFSRGKKV